MEDDKTLNMKDLVDRLTLGVTRILESQPGVTEVRFVEKEPAERHMIVSWEQISSIHNILILNECLNGEGKRPSNSFNGAMIIKGGVEDVSEQIGGFRAVMLNKNCCSLPEDLRNFYLMTDGFLMTWSIKFDGSNMQLGTMVINSISTLCRLGTTSFYSLPNAPTLADLESDTDDEDKEEPYKKPRFNSQCRIFELDCCNGNGKVCLVYKNIQSGVVSSCAEIWFLDRALYWHFLTDTFTAYYRLMLIHLGLPQWQYALTKYGISPQAKQWFNMYKPVTYNPNIVADDDVAFINKLDPNQVFKNKSKLQPTKKKSCVQLAGPQKSQTSVVTNKNVSQMASTTKK